MSDDKAVTAQARFKSMAEGTQEEWLNIAAAKKSFGKDVSGRVLGHLKLLEGQHWGFPVDRLTHSLQTATLAHRAGKDEEYVVCALLHDIGYLLAPYNHAETAAMILMPYITARNYWMIKHHRYFEGYYFFHHYGGDRDTRERFRGHPLFDYTAHFCEAFDQRAFDSSFEPMPLEAFEPMLKRIMSKPWSGRTAVPQLGAQPEFV